MSCPGATLARTTLETPVLFLREEGGEGEVIDEIVAEHLFAVSRDKDNFDTADARHMAYGLSTIGSMT